VKTKPAAGLARRVSVVLAEYLAEQPVAAGVPLVITQLIAGVSPAWVVTLPLPMFAVPLVILMRKGPFRKRADTALVAVILTLHVPVPLQAPPHPTKECPFAGAVLRVTFAP
jgi:hypothetical protein